MVLSFVYLMFVSLLRRSLAVGVLSLRRMLSCSCCAMSSSCCGGSILVRG
jgi:hypothetical protein